MKKGNFLAALCVVGILTTSPVSAMYSVTDLGALSSGLVSNGYAINESGQVVGRIYTADGVYHAFLYDQGTMYDLGPIPGGDNSSAYAINDSGQIIVTGQFPSWDVHSYIYDQGTWQDLGLFPGGTRVYATSINSSGQIAGFANTSTFEQHAVLYEQGELSMIGGSPSNAYAINDAGLIVGGEETADGSTIHPVLFDHGTVEDLGLLPGWRYARARAINNTGQIVGWGAMTVGGEDHAFIYENGSMRDLWSLPGGISAQAHDINDSGKIVGIAGDPSKLNGQHVFLYEQGVMNDLTEIVGALYPTVTMTDATGINNVGQIVGTATINRKTRAVLLTPDPLGVVTGADPDNDGVPASRDNCPDTPNPLQYDLDGDGIGLVCDNVNDSDGDGVADDVDNCPNAPNPRQRDVDLDGVGLICDKALDQDGDTIHDVDDNCPSGPNPLQYDLDNDGIGLVCDNANDRDGDGIDDGDDNCPDDPNPLQYDLDNDGTGLLCDNLTDQDGDGIDDGADNCPNDSNPLQYDLDNDGIGLVCDGNTVEDLPLIDRRLASETQATAKISRYFDEETRAMEKRERYFDEETRRMDKIIRYIAEDKRKMDKRIRSLAAEARALRRDADRDGYSLNEGDCDDSNLEIYPGAPEACADGIDQDCDGSDQECPSPGTTCDVGYFDLCLSSETCTAAGGYWWLDGTCNETEEVAPSGTVLYNGQMWQQADNGTKYNWDDANTYCANLSLAGFEDWRLPTKDELMGLVVCSNGTPTPLWEYPQSPWRCGEGNTAPYDRPTIDPQFSCVASDYWTSSMYTANSSAYSVYFFQGDIDRSNLTTAIYVRCVR